MIVSVQSHPVTSIVHPASPFVLTSKNPIVGVNNTGAENVIVPEPVAHSVSKSARSSEDFVNATGVI